MMNVSIKSGITDLGSSSSSNQQHLIGKYSIGAEIGRGSFANVYKGYDTTTNKPVAVKSVFRNRLKNKKLIENLEVEIKILQKLKNPHIVGLNDCIQTERHIHLFMEYCSLGDLSYFIKKRDDLLQTHPIISSILERYPSAPGSRGLHKTLVVNFLKQLSCALEFLRSQNLVHRDIKPQNLLLLPPVHSKNEFIEKGYNGLWELPVLKIADFGFARFLPSTSMAETLCGSPLYMAPEILRYEKYNAKADLWSVGAVIYEMSVGKPPFKASTPLDLLKKIERGKDEIPFPTSSQVCDELVRLICGLLKANPTERMGFQEFFNDPLIISDIECADEPLDCDIEEVDEQLFISEYLPNKNKMFGENYNTNNNNNNKINSPIVEEDEPLSSDQQDKSSLQKQQQQQQQQKQKQLKDTSSNIPKQERKKSESPADSLLYTVKNGTRIPSPMESSENDEIIKTLITKNSPTSTNNNNTGTTTNEFSNAKLKTSKSKNSKSDVLFEKDYVVVEKRTVEVNALADELANVGINEGNHQNTNNTTNNNSLGNAIAGPLIRRYSSSSRSNTGNNGSNNGRRTSFGDRKMPISISPSNALTKALGFTSNRLFNSPSQQQQQQQLHLQQAQLHQQQQHHHNLQQQQQQQSFIDSASTHLNKKLLTPSTTTTATTAKLRPLSSDDSHSNYDDNELIHQLENLSTMAHAISLFAEVKFSQLIPLPPSVVSTNIDLSDDDDYLNSNNGNLPPQMTKTLAEEGVALYVKTLTLLAKAMSLASDWWYNNNNTTKNSTSPKLNELVQWIRSRFNESLEKAEFLKLRLAEANELLNSDSNSLSSTTLSNTPIAEKLIFDRSLEMSRTAALNELRNEDLIGCELCYSTATWMLESLLTNTSTTNNNNDSINDDSNSSSGKLDANDRKTVELFINSIGNRLQILRIKIEKQQQLALQQQQQHSNNHHQEKP